MCRASLEEILLFFWRSHHYVGFAQFLLLDCSYKILKSSSTLLTAIDHIDFWMKMLALNFNIEFKFMYTAQALSLIEYKMKNKIPIALLQSIHSLINFPMRYNVIWCAMCMFMWTIFKKICLCFMFSVLFSRILRAYSYLSVSVCAKAAQVYGNFNRFVGGIFCVR